MPAKLKLLSIFIFIFIFGIVLRLLYINSRSLVFSYDQARDAFIAKQITTGDIKIQGPPTSTHDFFHGVLYYYVIAVGYFLGSGNPQIAVLFNSIINLVGAFVIFWLVYKSTQSKTASSATALLYATSYEQTQFSTYLANTFLATVTVPFLYLGVYLWHIKNKWGPLVAGIGLGLSVQANFFLLYHIPVILILVLLKKLPLNKSIIIGFLTSFLICISTMLLAEAKFGFPSKNGFINLLSRPAYTQLSVSSNRILSTYVELMSNTFKYNLWPQFAILSSIIVIILTIFTITSKMSWKIIPILLLFSSAPAIWLGGISTPYLNVGLSTSIFWMLGVFISRFHKFGMVIVCLVMAANVTYTLANYHTGQSQFSIQKTMLLKTEAEVIDYIYLESQGKPFSINTITAPLFSNTTWSYLFNWRGQTEYGYVPSWHGRDQIGQLGNNLARPNKSVERYFVIIEPTQGIPEDIVNNLLEEEKGYSTFNHKKEFFGIVVQNRTRRSL